MKRSAAGTYPSYKQAVKRQKVKKQKATVVALAAPAHVRKTELKNVDLNTSALITFNQTTANLQLLNAMIEGTAPTQHVGRRVIMKSLLIHWEGHLAPTTTGSSPLRCLVVYDRQTNAAASVATQVLAVDSIQSPMNLFNNHRYAVIADIEVPCVGVAGPQSWLVKRYVKLNHVVEFNETNGGTVADIQTGAVFCLFYQDGGLLIASPAGNFYSRIRFEDA